MKSSLLKNISVCLLAVSIPVFLALLGFQMHRYKKLEMEVTNLEKKQAEIIEDNKALVSEISTLSNSKRIEELAIDSLEMHQAESSEIIRVNIEGSKKNGK